MSEREKDWNAAVDSPESAPDVLGRENLAAMLAGGLSRSRPNESLVTAIYGSWGSGKSWLKHRILKNLGNNAGEVTVVEFTPWQIRGVDELTVQFFAQIHAQLEPKKGKDTDGKLAKRKRLWMSLARLSGAGAAALKIVGGAAAFSGNGDLFAPAVMAAAGVSEEFAKLLQKSADDVGAKAEQLASPLSAETARRELATLFSEPDTPTLLVVMDDFDRLTSDEIQTLIRLIKANANFPGLNYLIFCDPDHLAVALDPIAAKRGKEFLEKIVQNPIHLPPPNDTSIFEQLVRGIENIALQTGYPLQDNRKRLEGYYKNFLRLRLKNLRSVYRLIEAVTFSTSALTRERTLEVDLVDLVAVDFIRLHQPQFANWLHETGLQFQTFGYQLPFGNNKDLTFAEVLPQFLIGKGDEEFLFDIFRSLFPDAAKRFKGDARSAVRAKVFSGWPSKTYPLAISDSEHFEAYFRLFPNPRKIPENVYRAAVAFDRTREEIAEHLKKWIENGWLISSLKRLEIDQRSLTDEQIKNWFLALANCSDDLGSAEPFDDVEAVPRTLLWFMGYLFDRVPEKDRVALIESLFCNSTAVTARIKFLRDLRDKIDPGQGSSREVSESIPLLAENDIERFTKIVSHAIEPKVLDESYFVSPQYVWRIWGWLQAVTKRNTEPLLRRCLESDKLEIMFRVLDGIGGGIEGNFRLRFNHPDSLQGTASQAFLDSALKFADSDFWKDFIHVCNQSFPSQAVPEAGAACLLEHLRRGLTGTTEEITTD